MANNNSLTAAYDALPKVLKVLLQLFLGAIIGGIYRIIKFTETKVTNTLVAAILALIPPVSFVFWIVDLVTQITNDKITFIAE